MRYLLILLSFFLISCSEDEEEIIPTYTLELRYSGDRLTFLEISLPNYVLDVITSENQIFTLDKWMPTIEDVKVTLTFSCSAGNNLYNEDVLVNFYEDKKTVLYVQSVNGCNPDIVVLYE